MPIEIQIYHVIWNLSFIADRLCSSLLSSLDQSLEVIRQLMKNNFLIFKFSILN